MGLQQSSWIACPAMGLRLTINRRLACQSVVLPPRRVAKARHRPIKVLLAAVDANRPLFTAWPDSYPHHPPEENQGERIPTRH